MTTFKQLLDKGIEWSKVNMEVIKLKKEFDAMLIDYMGIDEDQYSIMMESGIFITDIDQCGGIMTDKYLKEAIQSLGEYNE